MVFDQKKRGTRVADLETKLNQAHEELKKVKERLAFTEQELQEFKKDQAIIQNTEQLEAEEEKEEVEEPQDQDPQPEKSGPTISEDLPENETTETETEAVVVAVEEGVANVVNSPATDVYEVVPSSSVVPSESVSIKSEANEMDNKENNENDEKENAKVKEEEETKAMIEEAEKKEEEFPDSPEVLELKAKLAEREKEMEIQLAENESLKNKASQAMAAAKAKEEEVGLKLGCLNEELRESRAEAERLKEKLGVAEAANAALESEMKRLRVQSDQWRKAAETAAAVLANGDAMDANGGRTIGERCGSMDKHHQQHIGNAGYGINGGGFVGLGSPLIAEEVDEEGSGSRKRGGGGGMRMFGDLWKKRSHQK